jgi:sucrose-6-phosphate hydrolase SacC (GH32 family)
MNNWQYGDKIPTAPWRSAMSVPRALALRTTPQGIRLVQQPVAELQRLRGAPHRVGARPIADGAVSLAPNGIAGQAMEIAAEFEAGTGSGSASEFGLKVRVGNGEETVIGVDPKAGQLFVDRTRSGAVDFHKDFPGRQTAPLAVENGRVRLRILVDWSSVEVFAADGRTVVTDQIFPAPESDGVALYAKGGAARLVSLEAWPLPSTWDSRPATRNSGTATTESRVPGPQPRRED